MAFYGSLKNSLGSFGQPKVLPAAQAPCLITSAETLAQITPGDYRGNVNYTFPNGKVTRVAAFEVTQINGTPDGSFGSTSERHLASVADLRNLKGFDRIINSLVNPERTASLGNNPPSEPMTRAGLRLQQEKPPAQATLAASTQMRSASTPASRSSSFASPE